MSPLHHSDVWPTVQQSQSWEQEKEGRAFPTRCLSYCLFSSHKVSMGQVQISINLKTKF